VVLVDDLVGEDGDGAGRAADRERSGRVGDVGPPCEELVDRQVDPLRSRDAGASGGRTTPRMARGALLHGDAERR
jgi:hypothetical protein